MPSNPREWKLTADESFDGRAVKRPKSLDGDHTPVLVSPKVHLVCDRDRRIHA